MKRVAVAILNWNGEKFLRQFLPGIVEHSSDVADVVIIDNNSTDESLNYVLEYFPEVIILPLESNRGFAGGYNWGLAQLRHEYFLLLNSDVEVTPNWLTPMLSYVDSQPGMVACQPKILDQKNRDRFEYAGAAGGYMDKDAYAFCAGRMFYAYEEDRGQYDHNEEVFWASGASLLIRRDAWNEVHGLDEDFFAHMEEIDLCWRLKNRGYRIGACRESVVYHVGGGTLDRLHPFKTYLNFRNNLYLILKNYRSGSVPVRLLRRMILDGVAAFRFLGEGNWGYFKSVFRAHCSFYYHFFLMLRKRRREAPFCASPNLRGMYTASIIRAFFIQGKNTFSQLDPRLFLK